MYMHLTVRLWFQNFPKSLNEYDLQGEKKKKTEETELNGKII